MILLLLVLATYRLSVMFAEDEGPFGVFEAWRDIPRVDSRWHRGVRCVGCTSVWVAAVLVSMAVYAGQVSIDTFTITWLGVSGAAMFINRIAPCPR